MYLCCIILYHNTFHAVSSPHYFGSPSLSLLPFMNNTGLLTRLPCTFIPTQLTQDGSLLPFANLLFCLSTPPHQLHQIFERAGPSIGPELISPPDCVLYLLQAQFRVAKLTENQYYKHRQSFICYRTLVCHMERFLLSKLNNHK